MSVRRLAVATAFAAVMLAPAFADNLSLPNGNYECSAYLPDYIFAGELQVDGNRYRGPALDGDFELGWIEFDSDADGNEFLIGKPFGGFTGMGFTVTAAVVDTDSNGNVLLQTSILRTFLGLKKADHGTDEKVFINHPFSI